MYGRRLRFKAFDSTVLFDDRIRSYFKVLKDYLEQEAFIDIACYCVSVQFCKCSEQQLCFCIDPADRSISGYRKVFAGRLVLDCEGQRTFRFFLRYAARHGLGKRQPAGRDLLIIVLQVDPDLAECRKFLAAAGHGCCLCFKTFDRTVLLGDRVLSGYYVFEHDLEQESVHGVACYFVAFNLAELFQGQFCLSFCPARRSVSSDFQVLAYRLV